MGKYAYIEDMNKWREEFAFAIEIKVRFSETDMFGHMNNVSPFVYFEEARIGFMKTIDLFDVKNIDEEVPIVVDLQCDYQTQVYLEEKIKVYVKVSQFGNSSIDLHYMGVKEDGILCFTGRGALVKMNVATGKPTPLSETEKEKLKSGFIAH